MSRRRVAWLVLEVVLLVGLALLEGRRTHRTGVRGDERRVTFARQTKPFLGLWGQAEYNEFSWDYYEGSLFLRVKVRKGGLWCLYLAEGELVYCTDRGSKGNGDWGPGNKAELAPYNAPEMRRMIDAAKIEIQAAAQRGEVTLPLDWEYAQ